MYIGGSRGFTRVEATDAMISALVGSRGFTPAEATDSSRIQTSDQKQYIHTVREPRVAKNRKTRMEPHAAWALCRGS